MRDHPTAGQPTVIVLRPGPHPYANTSFPRALQHELPEWSVVTVDVVPRLLHRRDRVARLVASALTRHGWSIARGVHPAREAVLRTPIAARLQREVILESVEVMNLSGPVVTIQMQSLFDGHLPGVPHFVYTDHTELANLGYDWFDPHRLYGGRWLELERVIYQAATACFVRSQHIRGSLMVDYGLPAADIELVGVGVNARVQGQARPEDSQRIVFVGVDWERKGGPELASAFAEARRRYPQATLTVVGCSPPEQPGMHVIGRVPLDEVSGHLSNSAIFALPTRVEPFGVAFLEAMAHGLPIIGTTVGAVPDFVEPGGNGVLVQPGDAAGLAVALGSMLADEDLRRRAGERSRQIVAERYTWSSVVGRMRPRLQAAVCGSAS